MPLPRPPAAPAPAPALALALAALLLATACGNAPDQAGGAAQDGGRTIAIDGSSTVGPLTDAIAEEYAAVVPAVDVNIGISGTGGGFERFCAGDIQIANASRPIKDDEVEACAANGVRYVELRVGTDALTMVTSPLTDWVDCLTKAEVREIWRPGGANRWSQVRPDFPDEPIDVYAPGVDSGTYDFLTEEILGKDAQARADYNASEDDNIIAQGVMGTKGAWGYFGFAYLQESAGRLKALAFDAGDGCVPASVETAQDGSYKLARPLLVYVRRDALAQDHVADFVGFYLDTVADVIEEVGYIAETEASIQRSLDALDAAIAEADA